MSLFFASSSPAVVTSRYFGSSLVHLSTLLTGRPLAAATFGNKFVLLTVDWLQTEASPLAGTHSAKWWASWRKLADRQTDGRTDRQTGRGRSRWRQSAPLGDLEASGASRRRAHRTRPIGHREQPTGPVCCAPVQPKGQHSATATRARCEQTAPHRLQRAPFPSCCQSLAGNKKEAEVPKGDEKKPAEREEKRNKVLKNKKRSGSGRKLETCANLAPCFAPLFSNRIARLLPLPVLP